MTCSASFGVSLTDTSLYILSVVMRCSTEGCTGKLQVGEGAVEKMLTAQQLFAASRGFGTPDEKDCSVARLTGALVGRRIVGLEVEETGRRNRPVIKSFLLEGGLRAHFGSSASGALIYKLTETKV